jgi:hypothetical protein
MGEVAYAVVSAVVGEQDQLAARIEQVTSYPTLRRRRS